MRQMEQGGHSLKMGGRKTSRFSEEQARGHCIAEAPETSIKADVVGKPEAQRIHHMLSRHLIHFNSPPVAAKGHCTNSHILRDTCLPPNIPQGNFRAFCFGHLQAHAMLHS